MSTAKKKFKETEVGKMRWYPHRGLPKVLSPVFSPFSYKETVLDKLKGLSPTDTIEFMAGGNVVFTTTVKRVTDVLSHVNDTLARIDIEHIDTADFRKLLYCGPWDFWKSEEVQNIIKRYIK